MGTGGNEKQLNTIKVINKQEVNLRQHTNNMVTADAKQEKAQMITKHRDTQRQETPKEKLKLRNHLTKQSRQHGSYSIWE